MSNWKCTGCEWANSIHAAKCENCAAARSRNCDWVAEPQIIEKVQDNLHHIYRPVDLERPDGSIYKGRVLVGKLLNLDRGLTPRGMKPSL